MLYFQPYMGLMKVIDTFTSKEKIFTSKPNKKFTKPFPPARFSLLNLSPIPVPSPAQSGQEINLDDHKQIKNALNLFPDKAQATTGTLRTLGAQQRCSENKFKTFSPLKPAYLPKV